MSARSVKVFNTVVNILIFCAVVHRFIKKTNAEYNCNYEYETDHFDPCYPNKPTIPKTTVTDKPTSPDYSTQNIPSTMTPVTFLPVPKKSTTTDSSFTPGSVSSAPPSHPKSSSNPPNKSPHTPQQPGTNPGSDSPRITDSLPTDQSTASPSVYPTSISSETSESTVTIGSTDLSTTSKNLPHGPSINTFSPETPRHKITSPVTPQSTLSTLSTYLTESSSSSSTESYPSMTSSMTKTTQSVTAISISESTTNVSPDGSGSSVTSTIYSLSSSSSTQSTFLTTKRNTHITWPQKSSTDPHRDYCGSQDVNGVTWSATLVGECSFSAPLCIDGNNMEAKKRCCLSDGWEEAPSCASTQGKTISNPCPSDLVHVAANNLCVSIIEGTTYPPKCPYEETVSFKTYKSLKASLSNTPIWMPIQRDVGRYGIGELLWMEHSSKYKISYTSCTGSCESFYYTDGILGKNCLVYHNSSYVEVVSCDDKYSAICAYETINTRPYSLCSQSSSSNLCRQSSYSSKSKCICVASTGTLPVSGLDRAEFTNLYQNLLYPTLSKEECYIGLLKTDSGYLWTPSMNRISYTFWSHEVNFESKHKYGAINSDGWIMKEEENEANSCVLYQTAPPSTGKASITLVFNEKTEMFTVTLSHPSYWFTDRELTSPMVYCFTDAAPSSIVYRIVDADFTAPVITENNVEYSFKPLSIVESGPGNYWCEAFLYPDLKVAVSDEILYRSSSYVAEYVAILKYKYTEENHPLSKDNMSYLQSILKYEIAHNLSFFPRLFKIYKVNESSMELTVNFHFSSTKSVGTYDEFLNLRATLEKIHQFTLEDFLSVDFCTGTFTNNSQQNIYWPITPVYELANPEGGLCMSGQGAFIKRYCYGNFTDGASWSLPNTPCTFYESSNITKDLLTIQESNYTVELIQQLVDLSDRYLEFVPIDVYLVSEIFKKFLENIDLTSLTKIVSNIMKVPKTVLIDSQNSLSATDKILYYVDRITEKSNENGKFSQDNFAIVIARFDENDFHGLSLTRCVDYVNCTISVLESDDIILGGTVGSSNQASLDAGFVFSDELLVQIIRKKFTNSSYIPKIIITIYNHNTLFNENSKSVNSSIIFGITLPEFDEEFQGPISFLFHNKYTNLEEFNCSFWEYDVPFNLNGYWQYGNAENVMSNIILCEFWHLTHIAIVNDTNNVDMNITVKLIDIERSLVDIDQKLKRANEVLYQYANFTAADVDLVAEILSQAKNVSKEELYYFTSILNNVMNIPVPILLESRNQYRSIDKLLNVYTKLFYNFVDESYFSRQNNLISLVVTDNSTFGVILDYCDSFCTPTFISPTENISELYKTTNFQLGFVLNQIQENLNEGIQNSPCNTAITIFLSDVLFLSSTYYYKNIGKTIGINFSDKSCTTALENTSLYYGIKSYGTDLDNTYYDCGIWDTDAERWISNTSVKNVVNNELLECDANSGGYYSFVDYDVEKNVSLEFQMLVDATINVTLSDIEKAMNLTAIFWRLSPYDIHLATELLSRVNGHICDDMLIGIVKLISNVMNSPRQILQFANEEYKAITTIRHIFDNITTAYQGEILVKTNNIILVILSLDSNDVSAIILKFNKGHFDLDLSDEFFMSSDVDSGIKISEQLIGQIKHSLNASFETPRIILSIHLKDVLFHAFDEERISKRIYSITIPGFHDDFIEPISIFFNVSTISNYTSCIKWSCKQSNDSCFWKHQCKKSLTKDYVECSTLKPGIFTSTDKQNVSDIISQILNEGSNSDNLMCQLNEVTSLYNDFSTEDVHNLVHVLNYLIVNSTNDLKLFNVIINNIIQIPRHVLRESQVKHLSSDRLLQRIVEILDVSADSYPTLYKNDFFAFNIWNPNIDTNLEQLGFVIYQNSTVTFIWKGQEKQIDFQMLDSLLFLSDDLLTQLKTKENCKIIVTIYLNDALFNEGIEAPKTTSKIFGVTMPDFDDQFDGKISLLKNNLIYDETFQCAFWDYSTNLNDIGLQGFWIIDDSLKNSTLNFSTCEYSHQSNYAYVENNFTNITIMLKEILEAGEMPGDTLTNLHTVLELYKFFLPIDVDLTAEILIKVHTRRPKDLETFVSIVNRVMKIPKWCLTEAQKNYESTDKILQAIDDILVNVNVEDTQIIDRENDYFAIIITTINVTSTFNGIGIMFYENKHAILYLQKEASTNDFTMLPTFEAGVVISPDLQTQLSKQSSRIILAMFYSDVLFNEKIMEDKVNSTVIGILLPDLTEPMAGSISLIYAQDDGEESYTQQPICSSWQFGPKNISLHSYSSLWKNEDVPRHHGNYISCDYQHLTHFALVRTTKNITTDLEDILDSNKTGQEKLELVRDITATKYLFLIPVDIYLISEIIIESIKYLDTVNVTLTAEIVSNLFNVPRYILRRSQSRYNATDMILHCIDEMGRVSDEVTVSYENFAFIVTDLVITDLKGVILNDCNNTICNITYMYKEINITQHSNEEHFGAAVIFSDELRKQIKECSKGKTVIAVYYTDVLFNENNQSRNTSRIFGIDFPEFNETFKGNISILHNTGIRNANIDNCAYWDFTIDDTDVSNISPGEWVKDSSSSLKNLLSVCEYSHVTNFALLLADSNSDNVNAFSLDLITNINTCLSVFGIIGILMTGALFEKWRKNTGNQILINFAISISINIAMLYVSTFIYKLNAFSLACTITGAMLHYTILAEFCWMLIIAILQFKRFVEVLGGRPKYVLLKALVCGWVFPVIPVICILCIDPDNYRRNAVGLCYPSDLGLYLGIWLPIVIIISINFVIFIFIIYNVFHKKTECNETVNHEILFQWRLALLLFFMLGLTWIFGFLGQIKGSEAFTYIFCVSATLQGFIMFLFFIVFNKNTRFLYSQWMKYWLYSKGFLLKK